MDLETGAFNDLLSLCYNYTMEDTAGSEVFDVSDSYTVGGVRRGAVIDFTVSGADLTDAVREKPEDYDLAGMGTVLQLRLYSDQLDTISVRNNGNAALRLRVVNQYLFTQSETNCLIDTLLEPGMELDLSGSTRGDAFFDGTYDETKGNIVILGDDSDQPYIIKTLNELTLDGKIRLWFTESAN